MEEFESITFKFFSVLLNMTDYMGKSSESLLNLLDNYEPTTAEHYKQKDEYHKILRGINSRTKKIEEEILSVTLRKAVNLEKKQIPLRWFNNLTQDLGKLGTLSKDNLSSNFFVDEKGKLKF